MASSHGWMVESFGALKGALEALLGDRFMTSSRPIVIGRNHSGVLTGRGVLIR
ncbi:hypothetical protein JIN77_14315 [Verrucomicrobiaceae bacterium R5-34]|nr:hypothetical protein [Verrucomicrobiaceae bacterium R5-34]